MGIEDQENWTTCNVNLRLSHSRTSTI